MRALLSVASVTFRESIRNRTLLAILVLAIGFIASALLLAELSLDQRVRVLKDWGLFCVSAFGVLLAILLGVSLVQKEIRRKSLYPVLSRPIHRWQYVLGKYLGLSVTLLVEVGGLTAALLLLLGLEGLAPDALLWQALLLSLVEILLLGTLAVFFASFSSPYLSGFFTLGLFLVGRSLPALDKLAERVSWDVGHSTLKGLFYALPDLASFNVATRAIYGLEIGWERVAWLALYGLGYGSVLLILSAWIFSRRDLT